MRDALGEAWFSTLGEPLGAGELADIAAYLQGLGLEASAAPRLATSWEDAGMLLRGSTGDWWEREEAERRRLEAVVHLDPADPDWIRLNDLLHGAAAVAAARSGNSDPGMTRVAAGAASYAAYHHELAVLAGCDEMHPFIRKYSLYAGGRWPLGVYDGRLAIF
jgi:hypothetical protein